MRPYQLPALALALGVAALAACDDPITAPGQDVPILHDYGSKIVYGTSRTLDVAALRDHCRRARGTFNECGTICAPGAEACATVCAFTCENLQR